MFSPRGADLERGWPGRIDGDRIVQLAAQTLQAFFTGGGSAREHAEYALAECDLRAPVLFPPSIRVFRPFERGETPFFSFRSPFPVLGPEEDLVAPEGAAELDYGLGLAAVIGAGGEIGGFTSRTTGRCATSREPSAKRRIRPVEERRLRLLARPRPRHPGRARRRHRPRRARVNGEERCGIDLRELVHPWDELRAHAARGTTLRPGDILVASAPAGTGPPLEPGDVVELEAAGIGVLRTTLVG